MRAAGSFTLVLAATMTVVAGTGVSAHRRDEYLQAARVALERDAVSIELDLTPGIEVADSIITMIDTDRDGVLSRDEQHAYAGEVVRGLGIALDDRPLPLRVISSTFPDVPALRAGEGTIRVEARAPHASLPNGTHRFFFRNPHLAGKSVYLANALVPGDERISITEQRRDVRQSELTIDYAVRGGGVASVTGWLLVGIPVAAVLMLRLRRRPRAA